jgi:hypothetical protein
MWKLRFQVQPKPGKFQMTDIPDFDLRICEFHFS